jgi:hypothetical protein
MSQKLNHMSFAYFASRLSIGRCLGRGFSPSEPHSERSPAGAGPPGGAFLCLDLPTGLPDAATARASAVVQRYNSRIPREWHGLKRRFDARYDSDGRERRKPHARWVKCGDKTHFKLSSAARTRKYRLIAMRTELRNGHTRTQFEATSSILLRRKGSNAMLRILSKALLAGVVVSALFSAESNAAVRHRHHIYRRGPEFYSSWASHEPQRSTALPFSNGSYYSLTNELSRSNEGTPCGVDCEASRAR